MIHSSFHCTALFWSDWSCRRLLKTDFTTPPSQPTHPSSKSAPNLLSAILVLEQQLSWPLIPPPPVRAEVWQLAFSLWRPASLNWRQEPGTCVEMRLWEWANPPEMKVSAYVTLTHLRFRCRPLITAALPQGSSPPVHKGNMCESACGLLSCLVFSVTW